MKQYEGSNKASSQVVAIIALIVVTTLFIAITGIFLIDFDSEEERPRAGLNLEHNSDGTPTLTVVQSDNVKEIYVKGGMEK